MSTILDQLTTEAVQNSESSFYMINTFKEYIKKQKDKVLTWMNSAVTNSDEIIISGPDGYGYLASLTRAQYEEALEDDDTTRIALKAITNDGSQRSVSMTKEEICDAVENQIADMTVQENFLDYCTSTVESVSSSEFCTRINSLARGVSASSYTLYTNILDTTNDPIEALKGFFSASSNVNIVEDEYDHRILILNRTSYVGNLYSSVYSQVINEITQAYNTVKTALSKVKDLFAKILTVVGTVAAWLLKKLFGQLSTDWENVKGVRQGLIDIPLMQINLTGYSLNSGLTPDFNPRFPVFRTSMGSGTYDARIYRWMNYYMSKLHVSGYTYNTNSTAYRIGSKSSNIRSSVLNDDWTIAINELIKKTLYLDEGSYETQAGCYTRVLEIPIPFQGGLRHSDLPVPDFFIRIGWNEYSYLKYDLTLQLFGAVNSDSFLSLSDESINMHLASYQTIEAALHAALDRWMPTVPVSGGSMATVNDHIISTANSSYTGNFAQYLSTAFDYHSYDDNDLTDRQKDFVGALLLYAIQQTTENDNLLQVINSNAVLFLGSTTSFDFNSPLEVGISDTVYNVNTYRPYTNENLTKSAVHLQTLQERASEIVHVLNVALIATVVVIASIKISKIAKNRRIKSDTLHGAYDALSWEYYSASDSDKPAILAQMKKYNKKARRCDRLNAVLGITSNSQDTTNIVGRAISQVNDLIGNNGKQRDYTEDFNSLDSLIH